MWPLGPHSLIQHAIKTGQRAAAIRLFLQAKTFLKERLVTPVRRDIAVRCQFVVSVDRALIILGITRGQFRKDVAFSAECLALFRRPRCAVYDLFVQREGILRFAQFTFDHRLFVSRRPFQFTVQSDHSI